MIDERRAESLKRRYGSKVFVSQEPAGRGHGPGRRNGPAGMGGRPKNAGATIKRLLSYLEQYKLGMGLALSLIHILF